jgi:hypothetical protein
MTSGENEDRKVFGYFLHKPCIIKIRDSQVLNEETETEQKSSFKVSLFPWMPLSSDKTIPIPSDWLVTMVEPKEKLKEMYVEDVINYGKSLIKILALTNNLILISQIEKLVLILENQIVN